MNASTPLDWLPELAETWSQFQRLAALKPVRSEEDLSHLQALADSLADAVGDDESHPLYSLFDLTMTLIEQWENEQVKFPSVPPRDVLRFLLEEHNLKQKDLEDIASPTLISDVLAGRREISKRLARSLAERFNVNIGAFI